MYANINVLRRDVGRRLRRGEHMVLYGPCGSGKSTLLTDLEIRLTGAGVPCARAATTHSLDDITRALEHAYPALPDVHSAPARFWKSADLRGGVLLLDHLTHVTNAMVRFLRCLRGGVLGLLTAVDVEVEHEQPRLKPWRLGALSMRMPPVSEGLLRELLHIHCNDLQVPLPGQEAERQLVRAARGRPGWILKCVELQAQGRYRQDDQILVSELSIDTETAMQQLVLSMLSSSETLEPPDDVLD